MKEIARIKMNNPTLHMKELCSILGENYSIKIIDNEQVIYRDFGNGYDIEISGANTTSAKKTVTIHLWKNKIIIAKTIPNVSQSKIGDCVEELYYLTEHTNSFDDI